MKYASLAQKYGFKVVRERSSAELNGTLVEMIHEKSGAQLIWLDNGEKNKLRVTVDIEGYRAKREETLRALARRKAAQALKNNRSVMLEPMSAYERRIIHSEVQGIEGVSTNSVGSDSNRKIVIYLTDKKAMPETDETEAAELETVDTVTEIEADGEIEVTETADASDDE